MPYRFVNLHTGAVSGAQNYVAEIGSCIVEFGDLSQLTGDARYVHAAKRAQQAVFDRRSSIGLIGTQIDVETGQWVGPLVTSTIDEPVDSFYEYLWDGYQFLGDPDELAMFHALTDAIMRYEATQVTSIGPSDRSTQANFWFQTVEYRTGAPTSRSLSELSAYYAGVLAQSGYRSQGIAFHDAWANVLHHGGYRILPEEVDPATYAALSKENDLRPEYVDSALELWVATNDSTYVDRVAEYYQNMKATSRVANGFTILTDVTARPETQGDLTPAYWFSENMKYDYLMFGHPARFDYATGYLSTEGAVLRGFVRGAAGDR
jgi:mannosyl-oligosaccharide alpha-1,2-mannosidase